MFEDDLVKVAISDQLQLATTLTSPQASGSSIFGATDTFVIVPGGKSQQAMPTRIDLSGPASRA
ncbi:hypothetical protein [Streptosporangium sandarakinum]|uniref:hypothetical protein n=1 Tax=Streptosporangium sandarakinum TaxID=1260955 RepID=UPI00342D2F7B